ncbi:uncharacterized protein CcaverHIS019_0408510 [Cutaneotrichosporon cavernicola]|uniref:Enhancer of mRNA-decapping protein 4 WD40 repeat region domain-containing protein n=1 Tax=Cutaneotrichosporon cavernicola TaxID=279322 RepID=A0AA48L4W9_9TREE|nr:uncharacterized protein CcaverHIS019_0408510 [Cutaneotrichosporon cavernicola]BEI92031.1 hypothetical protein CcaverHIS019_0408510 [Cutaneotrichosporon cavernicola]
MDNNPLLAMLKAAGTNSASPIPPAGPIGSTGSNGGSNLSASAASRPPPPAFQAVSLDDLFKSISQPPGAFTKSTPTPPSAAQANLATSPPGQHKAKLLGMLSLGVGAGSAQDTPEVSRPASGPQTQNREEQRRASLLGMLRSPLLNTAPALDEPVITHPAPIAPLPRSIVSPPPFTNTMSPPSGSAPAKSPFDFVSPFDAFDKPAPSLPQSGQGSAAAPSPVRTPSAKSTPAPSSPVKREYAIPQAAAAGTPASQDQAAPSPPVSRKDSAGPSLAAQLLQDAGGKGPVTLFPGGVTIDMAQPNLDAVVNHAGVVAVQPATIMKAESVAFSRGRTVGSAGDWIAYTLSRGRIRLLNMNTGARTLIQIDTTGPFVDLAVTDGALAVVLADGSVNAYRVPHAWVRDDPDCPLIFSLPSIQPGSVPADKSLGDINQIEWVRRENESAANWLAIGGTEGVIIVKPENWGQQSSLVNAREMLTNHRVLKASGLVVQFCLNATHQAIALISSSGYFCLYSVASLNKVWHRQLPSSNTATPLSSVRFCEAHIVVGRANDTMFDLVQITYELAVISTIKFDAPASQLSFGNAVYDSDNETLFISQFARGSVYAFRYKLKGTPPLRGVIGTDAVPILAFDSMAEFPIEPIVSMVLSPNRPGSPAFVYATRQGINRAQIDLRSLSQTRPTLTPAAAEAKPIEQKAEEKDERASVADKADLQDRPADNRRVRGRAAQADKRAQTPTTARKEPQRAASPLKPDAPVAEDKGAGPGLTADELFRALKKTEDKLGNQFKQAIQTEFGASKRGSADLSSSLSSAVTNHLQASLPTLIEQEVQRAIPAAVQNAVRELVPGAVHQSLQNIGRDVERILAPIVPRTLNTVVQPAVERAVREVIQQTVVPALEAATTNVYNQLAEDLKTEMVQIRKDVVAEQGDALAGTNDMIHNLSSMVESLQRQVAALSARSPPPGPVPSSLARSVSVRSPPVSQTMQMMQPATPMMQQPTLYDKQLEDAFLAALSAQSAPVTLKLVSDYASRTEQILPPRPGRSPVSQAVLLTLAHRLSSALANVAPQDHMFATVATWLHRAVDQLDSTDPDIRVYLPRVASVVTQELNQRISQLSYLSDQYSRAHISMLRQVIDELMAKL